MKRTEIKEMSSVFYIGKWTVIIAILITSSLSFTLGYFVGKSFQPPVVKQTTETKETKKTLKTRKYTVQTGTFKDISDANALKSRLDKKGYKTYIAPTETKTHKKLYKVMGGDFVTRNEAEVLSLKINKGEGLKKFVTFKTDQEDLR